MIFEITSRENAKVKYAASLKLEKYRKENSQFLAEGIKSLELALKSNLVTDVFTTKKLKLPNEINQYITSLEVIEKISSTKNPEGIVFICNALPNKKPAILNKVIYLDNINDPGNMGTIIRTALAFDYDAIVVSKGSVSIYNEKVIASSKGAIFLIPIFEDDGTILNSDLPIIVSSLSEKSIYLKEVNRPDKFVLVLGNESHGVSEPIINKANIVCKIPISNIDSLNVSVAAGILMEYFR